MLNLEGGTQDGGTSLGRFADLSEEHVILANSWNGMLLALAVPPAAPWRLKLPVPPGSASGSQCRALVETLTVTIRDTSKFKKVRCCKSLRMNTDDQVINLKCN